MVMDSGCAFWLLILLDLCRGIDQDGFLAFLYVFLSSSFLRRAIRHTTCVQLVELESFDFPSNWRPDTVVKSVHYHLAIIRRIHGIL